MKFEDELKRAFAPEDPGDAFTARVLAGVKAVNAANAVRAVNGRQAPTPTASRRLTPTPKPLPRMGTAARWRMVLAFAASLSITTSGVLWMRHVQYVQDGERARAQVLVALRLTSEKLNVVRAAVTQLDEPR
jgi:hypothetical protein